jgi:hypothetical protein
VFYREVFKTLNAFPRCVKIVVFIDSCQSGGAISALQGLCEGRLCGTTIVTAADAEHSALGPTWLSDSATEDFIEESGDLDGDAKKGDFGDCWQHMKSDGGFLNPQRFMCPGQTSMCSTD